MIAGKQYRRALLLAAAIGLATSAEAAITGVTHGRVDLTIPPSTPAGQVWRYGLGMPIQLDATTAGLLVNIRRNDTGYWDYEVGTDLIKFSSLNSISASNAVPISRAGKEPNPDTSAPSVTCKYPMFGGFVPLGAKSADGSAHPYAGTGFGLSVVAFFPAKFPKPQPDPASFRMELSQFRYDGSTFTASKPVRTVGLHVGSTDWYLGGGGLSPAIPDGNDLLYPGVGSSATGGTSAGVARFQYDKKTGWQPTSFVPVTDARTDARFAAEPSLIRDVDGSLLFTGRDTATHILGNGENIFDIALWQSTTGKVGTWKRSLFIANVRREGTMSLNQALDGTPYLAANTVESGTRRNSMQIIPINATRSKLELGSAITARNALAEFGPPPTEWELDHAMGNVVRLADGQWHGLFTYRGFDLGEHSGRPATAYTGLYVEEVSSSGAPRPMGFGFASESHRRKHLAGQLSRN